MDKFKIVWWTIVVLIIIAFSIYILQMSVTAAPASGDDRIRVIRMEIGPIKYHVGKIDERLSEVTRDLAIIKEIMNPEQCEQAVGYINDSMTRMDSYKRLNEKLIRRVEALNQLFNESQR